MIFLNFFIIQGPILNDVLKFLLNSVF